jgi:hypothetical protein
VQVALTEAPRAEPQVEARATGLAAEVPRLDDE